MKKLNLLLGLLIGFMILSCSSEDTENSQTELSQLVQVEQRRFDSGTLYETIVINYSNQKPELWNFYDGLGLLTFYSEWNYNTNGLISSIEGYLPNGNLDSELVVDYDDSQRIIQTTTTEGNGTFTTTTNFTHNSDNTISSSTDSNGNMSNKTFEINSNGIIDKQVVNGNVVVSV